MNLSTSRLFREADTSLWDPAADPGAYVYRIAQIQPGPQAMQVLKGCTPQPDDRLLRVRTGKRVELLFQQRESRRDPEQLNAWVGRMF